MCTLFWNTKGVNLLDFLEPGQAINSGRYSVMLTAEGSNIHSQARKEDNISLAT
jgi:hypothetical protein